jgi:hypothetical protein
MSKQINNGGPAFPIGTKTINHDYYSGVSNVSEESGHEDGMTLRDYFAAKAMQVLLGEHEEDDDAARKAYKVSDAMLAAREGGAS